MSAAAVTEAWARIEDWCRRHHPRLLGVLNPAAPEVEISGLERAIKRALPEDVRTSLMIHNGQHEDTRCRFLFGQLTLASCERIAWEWMDMAGSSPGDIPTSHTIFPTTAIQNRYFADGWLPIAFEEGCGNYLAVDLSPGPAGAPGQVIDFGADIHNPGVMAPNWGAFLLSYAELLESGVLAEISQDPDDWFDDFHPVWGRACLDGLVLWAMDGRWPMVKFAPGWRTTDVVGMARQIDESRDFSAMPVLADALQDAGCDTAAILNHCRDPNCTHARGCWVIDSLLRGRVEADRWCHKFPREP